MADKIKRVIWLTSDGMEKMIFLSFYYVVMALLFQKKERNDSEAKSETSTSLHSRFRTVNGTG